MPYLLPAVSRAAIGMVGGKPGGDPLLMALSGGRGGRAAEAKRGTVAVIGLYGVIVPRGGRLVELLGGTSAERFTPAFRGLMADPSVSAVVIDVDSAGGDVAGVEEVSHEIYRARGIKPVVAIANHTMASAAYWIASAASEIVATPSAEIGSIGVFAAHTDISEAEKQAGIKTSLVSAGRYKTEGNPHEPLDDEARAAIQRRVNDYYEAFTRDVARNRGVSISEVRNGFGEGRAVGARQAQRLKLADRIETFDQLFVRLSRQAVARPVAGARRVGTDAKASGSSELRRYLDEPRIISMHDRLLSREVGSNRIDHRVLATAQATLANCRRGLGVTANLGLNWFESDFERFTAGMYLVAHDQIWLSSALTVANVAHTVAHEVKHAHQYQTIPMDDWRMGQGERARSWRESDATAYADRICGPSRAR